MLLVKPDQEQEVNMITITHTGGFTRIDSFFKHVRSLKYMSILEKYARMGVDALSKATPIDTGLTAESWSYKLEFTNSSYKISWINSNTVNGVPIAIILQYGHAMGNGGYVVGRDYINPTIKPIFDEIEDAVWKEVINT